MTKIALALLLAALCSASAADGSKYQALLDRAVSAGWPGVQALVREGEARWSGVAGLASVEEGRAMAGTDRLRLASLTKMMTAAVVLRLAQLGRLQLSDKITTVLPAGTLEGIPQAENMTVAQLLEHRSGLHNFNGNDARDFFADLYSDPNRGSRLWTAAELLSYAKKPSHRPTGEPGEEISYSSTGYIVLEMIAEALEQKPLAQLLREHLFDPLEMKSAGMEGVDFGAREIDDSYARQGSGESFGPSPFERRKSVRPDGLVNLSNRLDHYNAWARGAGAVAANAEDLGKFMEAVAAGKVEVMTNQAEQFAKSREKPDAYFDWNGGSSGIQTTILFQPARDLTVIVLTNTSNTGPGSREIALQMREAARNQ